MTSQSTSPVSNSGSKDKPWLLITLASVVVAFSVFSRSSSAEWLGDSQPHMGTEISVYLWHDDAATGQRAVNAIFSEVARLDQLMSTYIESSEISAVNRDAAFEPVTTGEELLRLIQRSLDISVLTLGAFDITYDSVGQHYDFREGVRPSEEIVAEELASIDYRLVKIDATTSTVSFAREGVRINLGGIAKGYAVERGVEIAKSFGVRHARVTAGGDTRLLGDRRGQPWMVGIRDPRVEQKVAVTLPMEDEAISTSGDYERFFVEDGERYHHILEPSTGAPAGKVHSATIIGPDAVLTDALSTSVFVLGVDQGLRLIATLPDYEGIVIDADGQMFYSAGLGAPP